MQEAFPGGHEHPPVLHRPQPLHLFRRHRADGHDAAPDRPRAWPRAVGGDLEMFIYERIRNEQDHQRVPLKHARHQPAEVAGDRRADGGEPRRNRSTSTNWRSTSTSRVARLERLFQKYLLRRHYLKLRLIRARQLLKQTSMSIIEVASVCGFVSTRLLQVLPRTSASRRVTSARGTAGPAGGADADPAGPGADAQLLGAVGPEPGAGRVDLRQRADLTARPCPSTGRAGPVSPRHQGRQQLPGNRLAHRRQRVACPPSMSSTSRRSSWARSGLRPRTAYSQACSGVESGGTLKPSACRRSRKSSWSIRSACIIAAAPSMGIAIDSAEPTSLPARLSRLDMGRSFSANSTVSDTATITSSGLRNAADGFRKTPDSH